MDDRTARVLDSLDPVGVTFLLQLLDGPATEVELVRAAGDPTQPTSNRRLHRLEEAGLVAREPGRRRAPLRQWSLLHPDATTALLTALFELSEAIDARDRARREASQRSLKRRRAVRIGLREVRDAS